VGFPAQVYAYSFLFFFQIKPMLSGLHAENPAIIVVVEKSRWKKLVLKLIFNQFSSKTT
jgi:hypothetical protein